MAVLLIVFLINVGIMAKLTFAKVKVAVKKKKDKKAREAAAKVKVIAFSSEEANQSSLMVNQSEKNVLFQSEGEALGAIDEESSEE